MHNVINKLAGGFSSFSRVLMGFSVALVLSTSVAFAEEAAPSVPASGAVAAVGAPARPSTFETIMPFILMFGVMYFLILRPQQKKAKEQQEMLSKLSGGDEVITTSGILGRVHSVAEKVVTLEVADNVRMKFLRSQIAQKVSGEMKS
jgi:preprotein translocase subunit YajC